jgi:hypothetical protein
VLAMKSQNPVTPSDAEWRKMPGLELKFVPE